MKMYQMATRVGGIVRGVFLILLFLEVKLTSLNGIKTLLVVLEKQKLKILLNSSIQHQEHLIILMNALNQFNYHNLKNLDQMMKKVILLLGTWNRQNTHVQRIATRNI
jgi:hypothetical protein